jgi:hypothetical protein
MCINNGGQSAINETKMNKSNGSAKMKLSAENPATAHTLDRYMTFRPPRRSKIFINMCKYFFMVMENEKQN